MPIGFSIWGPPLIGAAASAGFGKLFGGSSKVGPTSPTFRRAEQLGDITGQYATGYALPEGKKLLGQAESTLQQPTDYYSKLLSGNRAEMMAAEAPEIQTITDQYGKAQADISKFTPQGGGQTGLLSELPFQKSRDVTTLLEKARPAAAQQLESIAGQQAAMSGMVTGEGLQAGQLSLNAISDQINALLGKASQDIPLQQQTGAGIYSLLKGLISQSGGGGGGDSSTTSLGDFGFGFPGGSP